MSERSSLQDIDGLLLPLLGAPETKLQNLLSDLVHKHAEPIIRSIVKYKLRLSYDVGFATQAQEAEDICGLPRVLTVSCYREVTTELPEFSHPLPWVGFESIGPPSLVGWT